MTILDWIQAGYFLISTRETPWHDGQLLPQRVVTASNCIVDCFPDTRLLPPANSPGSDHDELRSRLQLHEDEYSGLLAWIDSVWSAERFGPPGVFFSLDDAREFCHRFLGKIDAQIRLIGLSLDSALVPDYEEALCRAGVVTKLLRLDPLAPGGKRLGFDVLGEDAYDSEVFHTFSCNGLEKAYSEILGVSFNEHGLIEEYPAAVAECDYTTRDEVGAEPAAWFPFRIDEYALYTAD